MNKAVTPTRWFSGWRTADRPMQDDPADLGTAFGLEMSLNETAREAACADAIRNGTDGNLQNEAKSPKRSSARQPGLMQRLRARRKTVD
jgi:hypothetical protein